MKPIVERFWTKVTGGDYTTCWLWTASTSGGYGQFGVTKGITVRAHRWSYEHLIGDIPAGLQLDHLCRNRACVNPWHLEPVNPAENLRRGAGQGMGECPHGHAYDETNTHITTRGSRRCRACDRLRHTPYRPHKRPGRPPREKSTP